MKKIKIAWITGSSMLDTDEHIIPLICEEFEIRWIVIRQQDAWYTVKKIQEIIDGLRIDGHIFNMPGRLRSYAAFRTYWEAIKCMKDFVPDLYYVDYIGVPYLWPLIGLSSIDNNRIIYPCHDYKDHLGVKHRKYYAWTKKLIFSMLNNFQFYSQTQEKMFRNDYPTKKYSFYAPLILKDFGKPTVAKSSGNIITFLFFGTIRPNKGLEFLIEAVNELYCYYAGRFRVKIYGNCDCWEKYLSKILHPECFDFQIRRIENEEIPNLFVTSDYLILPYRDVTQSGPLLIAYNYQLPVIASDHPGFGEYINHGSNGFLFQNENSTALYEVMKSIIEGKYVYNNIKSNLVKFIADNCSAFSIREKYIKGLTAIYNNFR